MISIHRKVAFDHRCDARFAGGKSFFESYQIICTTGRRGVASVCKCMDKNFVNTSSSCELGQGDDVAQMTMDATVADKSQ